ncbi:MAG: hypothetical protein L3J18_15470 [Candidatus Brocadia sp.]|nr:hypothetical protein [Candidatus Brocadia sp.]UJS20277.1 MAG: hypothetical protein L3J18_15470 [Candidatus Brocadia sp.]
MKSREYYETREIAGSLSYSHVGIYKISVAFGAQTVYLVKAVIFYQNVTRNDG